MCFQVRDQKLNNARAWQISARRLEIKNSNLSEERGVNSSE